MTRTATIKDVARHAGVTHPVVSTVLGNSKSTIKVSPATAKRVLEAARELKYKPSVLARSFQQRKSFLVGVLVSEAVNWLLADLLDGVQEQLSQQDYTPAVLIHRNVQQERAYLRRCMDRQVDGLIVNLAVEPDGQTNADAIGRIIKAGVPVVEIFGRTCSPSFSVDFRADGRAATQHLLQMGHRRIALLTHEQYRAGEGRTPLHWDAWEYSVGYEEAMRAAGMEPIIRTHPLPTGVKVDRNWTLAAEAIAPQLFADPLGITAVVCELDQQAYGIIRAARNAGISVPQQLSIVGHRDLELSELVQPMVTTFRPPAQQIGRAAAQAVFDLMNQRQVSACAMSSELMNRGSAAPLA